MTQLVTLSCNLVTQKIQTTQLSDSSEMSDFIEHSYEVLFVPDTDVECEYSRKQVKDSSIFTIFVDGGWAGGGGVCHNVCEIWRGVRAYIAFVERGYCVISFFAPPHPPDNYCTVPKSIFFSEVVTTMLWEYITKLKGYTFLFILAKTVASSSPCAQCYNSCCRDQPCLNGGTCREKCQANGKRFICDCYGGFTGQLCQTAGKI